MRLGLCAGGTSTRSVTDSGVVAHPSRKNTIHWSRYPAGQLHALFRRVTEVRLAAIFAAQEPMIFKRYEATWPDHTLLHGQDIDALVQRATAVFTGQWLAFFGFHEAMCDEAFINDQPRCRLADFVENQRHATSDSALAVHAAFLVLVSAAEDDS